LRCCAGGSGYFITQVVDQHTTGVTLKSSASPTASGSPVTITATVTPGSTDPAKPTGVVTFHDAGVPVGSARVSTSHGSTEAHLSTTSRPAWQRLDHRNP
jgi:hypothetical protein